MASDLITQEVSFEKLVSKCRPFNCRQCRIRAPQVREPGLTPVDCKCELKFEKRGVQKFRMIFVERRSGGFQSFVLA